MRHAWYTRVVRLTGIFSLLLSLAVPAHADVAAASVHKPSPSRTALKGKHKAKPQPKRAKVRRARVKRVKVPDGRLAAALAWPRVALPPGLFERAAETPIGAPQGSRTRIEESLQEEITPPPDAPAPRREVEPSFTWPVIGPVRSPFGPRHKRFHAGIDISAPQNEPVLAAADGLVLYAGASRGPMGNAIVLQHEEDLLTVYAHLSRIRVKVGEVVREGEQIGAVGSTGRSTGPHLHFAVRDEGRPVNPLTFLPSDDLNLQPHLDRQAAAR